MLIYFFGLFAVLFCVDMGIKQYIEEKFDSREERDTIIDKVVLRKVHNKGFFMNSLDKYPKIVKGSSLVLGILLLIYNIQLFAERGRFLEKLGMVILSAGAASNIFDRLVRGKVVDYIGFKSKIKYLRTLTANLADFFVVIGAVLVAVAEVLKK